MHVLWSVKGARGLVGLRADGIDSAVPVTSTLRPTVTTIADSSATTVPPAQAECRAQTAPEFPDVGDVATRNHQCVS